MAADGQPAGQPDLAELVYRRLEGSEAMRQAQGVLQAAAVDELRGVRPQMPEPPPENVLIHALIDEYLEYNRLNACRSLLETETGWRAGAGLGRPAVRAWADGGRLVTESSATARARRAYADAVARARSAAAEDMGDAQGVDLRVAARSGLQGTIADDPADAPSAASSPDRPVRLAGWGSVPASSVPGGGGSIRRAAGSSARERQGPMVSFRMDS
ncbi:hypothetical protein FNF29_02115 [Cafeteria roenbergensis]|uniref:LisH domain-containing protein n=1 Tax=Cafeteria roenbergensis TaxID=33653 RepID=A0A5A8CT71_CAFRO|nr:hypothetical protein FNF29_02115 [Cafeteria roenbergensis]|eukprot:KAA0154971.1 hypothetical protein FNF29_02115 [Cafeteria roenbergensis]